MGNPKEKQLAKGGHTDKTKASEDVKTLFKFVFVKVIILGKEVMHVEQGAVLQERGAQVFINGEDDMPVSTAEEFEGHFSGAVNAVLVTTGRAKFGMAAKGYEFKFATMSTAIHGTAKRRIATVNHLFDVFHDNGTGMKDIFYFFIVFYKNLLKYIHKSIMQEMWSKSNPTPQE